VRIKLLFIVAVSLIVLQGSASALLYDDKPYFTAYIAQNNHIDLGKETSLVVVIQNTAKLWRQIYDSADEFRLLTQNPDYLKMLTTAVNVSVKFESEELKIKTPEVFFAALPAFQPVQIPLVVDASGVDAGEYNITMKIRYDVVDDVSFSSKGSITPVPSQEIYSYTYNSTLRIWMPTPFQQIQTYQQSYYLEYFKFEFKEKTQEINLKVVVEKPDVVLNVTDVRSDLIAGGKGRLTLTVKNEGKRDAENLFVVLSVPSGFVPQGIQKVDTESINKALNSIINQNPQLSMLGIQNIEVSLPSQLQTVLSQSSVYVGTLKANQSINITFAVDVNAENGGYYPFQISGVYTADGDVKQTSPASFGVDVRDRPEITVKEVDSTVFAGSKGDVTVKLSSDVELRSVRGKLEVELPLSIIAGQFYAGDGNEFEMKFKVKAGDDAENTVYPGRLTVTYDLNGKEVSEEFDIGISVGEKIRFQIDGKGTIPAGGERVVTVKIKNAGGYEIRDATARITVVDPFSTTDDSSFIGDLKPGEEKEISFRIKADKDATPKNYALNLEVKYRDANGEWVISEPVKLPIQITERQQAIPGFEAIIGIIGIIGAIIWLRR